MRAREARLAWFNTAVQAQLETLLDDRVYALAFLLQRFDDHKLMIELGGGLICDARILIPRSHARITLNGTRCSGLMERLLETKAEPSDLCSEAASGLAHPDSIALVKPTEARWRTPTPTSPFLQRFKRLP